MDHTKIPSHEQYRPCLKCGKQMDGILSYEARELCTPCGGVALAAQQYTNQKPEGKK